MKHIFISHASANSGFAHQLAKDLRNEGHHTKVDTHDLSLGDNVIEFINKGIAEAHTVIILYSKHTRTAKWQLLEIDSAVWNQVVQEGGKCIVVRLDGSPIPPLLGPKVYGQINPADSAAYCKWFKTFCKSALKESAPPKPLKKVPPQTRSPATNAPTQVGPEPDVGLHPHRPRKEEGLWTTWKKEIAIGAVLAVIGIPMAVLSDWAKYLWGPPPKQEESQPQESKRPEAHKDKSVFATITFDSTNPNDSAFQFGKCPAAPCFTIERDGRKSIANTDGQVFLMNGPGFSKHIPIQDAFYANLQFITRNAQWGFRFHLVDGSWEDIWPFLQEKIKDLPSKAQVARVSTLVWIPIEQNLRAELIGVERDLTIVVLDDSVNRIRANIQVSPGTLCASNKEFRSLRRGDPCISHN